MSNIPIIEDFVSAVTRDDLEAAFGLMAEDIVYHNIPMPPLRGARPFASSSWRQGL
jgi:ketosteroid isomerase-like protein